MTRRVLAPVLLLLAAAVSIAAVFAVQRIESRGGPLAEPSVSPYFSPDDDGRYDEAEVRFTTQRPELLTVVMVDGSGATVRTLLHDGRVDGSRELAWDGTDERGEQLPEGEYDVRITRAGDDRTYAPTNGTVLDVTDPVARLDRWTWVGGELRGLALLEPGARLEITTADGQPLPGLLAFLPRPEANSAQPEGPQPPDTVPVRFTAPVDTTLVELAGLQVSAVDLAGNARDLLAGPNPPRLAVID